MSTCIIQINLRAIYRHVSISMTFEVSLRISVVVLLWKKRKEKKYYSLLRFEVFFFFFKGILLAAKTEWQLQSKKSFLFKFFWHPVWMRPVLWSVSSIEKPMIMIHHFPVSLQFKLLLLCFWSFWICE